MIQELDADKYRLSVDGPFHVWVEEFGVNYFVLFALNMTPKANVNENKIDQYLREKHEINGK